MNGFFKGMLFVLVLFYWVSPIDACPGPIDDLLFTILVMSADKGRKSRDRYLD